MDWDRIITQMIRAMIQQCFAHPTEFLTFRQLAWRIPGADADVLHAIAESRPGVFVLTKNSKAVKLEPSAIEPILKNSIDLTSVHAIPTTREAEFAGEHVCGHLADDEILRDLRHGTLPSEALTKGCCWKRICFVRGRNIGLIPADDWTDVCRIRGYLLRRRNPRGF